MEKKTKGDGPGYQGAQNDSNGSPGETGQNESDGVAAEKIDDLKRWLSGDDTLLSWLTEGPDSDLPINSDMDIGGADELQEDQLALKEKVADYEDELTRLRKEISEMRSKGEIVGVGDLETARKLHELSNENTRLLKELENAKEIKDALKSQFESSLSNLPEDRALIIKKEVALKELEKEFFQREKEISEKEDSLRERVSSAADDETGLEERFHAELKEKDLEFRHREQELLEKVDRLERNLKQKVIDDKLMENELKIARMTGPEAEKEIQDKVKELQLKEKSIMMRDAEIEKLRIEAREKDDELSKIKSVVSYKEEEILRREEDLLHREKVLSEERRRYDEMNKQLQGVDEVEMKKRLEELKMEIQRKEEEIRAKEKYLNAKMEELRRKEQGIIEDEISAREQDRTLEVQQAKVKTGNDRLDDLLLGGIPFGSNILIHGPPFIGKEVMVNQFIAEGLRKGLPAIWVITDKTPREIREEMNYILSGYEEYEKLELVKYVDSYSRSMGETADDPYTTYIDEPTDHDKIMNTVEQIVKEYRKKHEFYRLAFRSISTLIAYSDPNTAFRFLSPFCGRRKRDKAVALYTIEKGMHGEQEIQMLGSIMDGMIDFKVDQLKSFFAVSGISDVQSRTYIRYTSSKHGLTIGSFSLDHIR
ncbi:MAG: ATPase domain-containing protein [Methanomassiliicoccales archaeon]